MAFTNPYRTVSRFLVTAPFLLLPSIFAQPAAAAGDGVAGAKGDVYVLSNQASGNSVIVFHRDISGMLSSAGSFATGGSGAGSGADPLGSQNPVVLSRNEHFLFAVNAGSDSISAFQVDKDKLVAANTVSSGGTMPVSLTVRGHLLYALNAGGTPNIAGFTIAPGTGKLTMLQNSMQPLPGGASAAPAQVSFRPGGHALVATETGTNLIDTFVLKRDGTPQPGVEFASSATTPFGFAFSRANHVAVVSDAEGGNKGASELSSYRVKKDGNLVDVTAGVGDTQTAACWVVVANHGRYAYTSNTGSGTISSYTVSGRGKLALLDVSAGTGNTPVDMGLSHEGKFLYVRNAGDGTITGFQVRSDGSLKQVGTIGGLPDGAAGLAAR
ncbi:MAG TPA: beta-propeller fold lactonase family protein [Rhizomicrobium sp.]|jgi:6-phosphogluconolactonase (cycloisomerase 2 family)